MVVFILDASALLRWIDDESGSTRVNETLSAHLGGSNRLVMSALHLGEVPGVLLKRDGLRAVRELKNLIRILEIGVVSTTSKQAESSAVTRFHLRIPYVDSFAVELASASPNHVLITGDFDFRPAENEIRIEFLPAKQKLP